MYTNRVKFETFTVEEAMLIRNLLMQRVESTEGTTQQLALGVVGKLGHDRDTNFIQLVAVREWKP